MWGLGAWGLGCVGVGAWWLGRVGVGAQGWLVRCRSHREGRLLAGADSSRGRGVPGEAGVPWGCGDSAVRRPWRDGARGATGARRAHGGAEYSPQAEAFPGACGSASGHRRRLGGPAWLSTIARPVGHLPAVTAPYRDGLAAAAGCRASLRTCLRSLPDRLPAGRPRSWCRAALVSPGRAICGHGWSSCRLGDWRAAVLVNVPRAGHGWPLGSTSANRAGRAPDRSLRSARGLGLRQSGPTGRLSRGRVTGGAGKLKPGSINWLMAA